MNNFFPITDYTEIQDYLSSCAPYSIYTKEGFDGGQHVDVHWFNNKIDQKNYFFGTESVKSVWGHDAGENEGPHDLLVGETIEGYWFFLHAGSGYYTGWEIGGNASVILAPSFEELYYFVLDDEDRERLPNLNVLLEKTLLEKQINTQASANKTFKL